MASTPKKPRKPSKPRTSAQNAEIYRRRVARGAALGLTPSESVGKANRDNKAEYARKVAREVAAGKRLPPKAMPANRQAPSGGNLTQARRFLWPNPAEQAETKAIARIRSDRRVYVYCKIATITEDDLIEAAGEDIDYEELEELDPWYLYQLLTTVADIENVQLWPNGGIRAQTLRTENNRTGGFRYTILEEIGRPQARYRTGSNPAINPQNRREKSPIANAATGSAVVPPLVFILEVVLQWQ